MAIIAIIGASGQLGQQFNFMAQFHPMLDFLYFTSDEVDITDRVSIREQLDQYDIDYIINCAAFTQVDLAESQPEKAYAVNRDGAGYIAAFAHEKKIPLIHFSSDYVYHNSLNRPLMETDPVAPAGVYAISKLAGEERIAMEAEHYLIFRTSWLYSTYGHNFLKTMLRLGREKEQLNVVYDQIGAPTYARDVASKVLKIIDGLVQGAQRIEDVSGIYNLANAGVASWYDFAWNIMKKAGLNCSVQPVSSAEYVAAAPRPYYSVLDQTKLNTAFGIRLAHWQKGLDKCFRALNEE